MISLVSTLRDPPRPGPAATQPNVGVAQVPWGARAQWVGGGVERGGGGVGCGAGYGFHQADFHRLRMCQRAESLRM